MIEITRVDGIKEIIPYDDLARCDNCGKSSRDAKECITGRYIVDEEWACCEECYDEMVEKGCCFEELGPDIYRQQKY